MQQPGQFELIDVGLEYHAPGKVLRTTNHPSPTVPISPALQSALPLKTYDVIATNADLNMDQLMTVDYGDSLGLQFGFKESAAQKLAKISTAHSISMNSNDPYYLCILLENVVEFCPSISMPHISGGVGFKFDDRFLAQRLSSILRNGQLPVELHVIKVETIYSQSTN
jgi:preprotein translocase subunit SecD